MYWFEIIIENSTFTDIDNETQTLVWNATFEGDYNCLLDLVLKIILNNYGIIKIEWVPKDLG